MNKLSLALLLLAGLQLACAPAADKSDPADSVFTNGRIYTVDTTHPWAEAVAVRDGRIVYVGDVSGVDVHIGSDTRVVDLKGRMMMPAFQDSHLHPIDSGMTALRADLSGVSDLAGYRERISGYAETHPEQPWILGGGWTLDVFGPGGRASKSILDTLVPDRPVYLESADGHTAWVNSRALEVAGIDTDTPDPDGGVIDRDPATGAIIGSLQESARELVSRHIPPATAEERLAGMRYTRDMLHSYGITSFNDAHADRASLETYRALEDIGELNLRIVASLWWERERGLEQIADLVALRKAYTHSEMVRPIAVKIMQDGIVENYTAAMLEPYLLPGNPRGMSFIDPDVLKQAVSALDEKGFQVHFHAIGDAAVRQSLDAVEAALRVNGQRGNRHHISHLEVIHPQDRPRFAELATIANFQLLWAFADEYITELTLPYLAEEQGGWLYPIHSVQAAGGMLAFGSDWSVSTANPFPQMEVAVTRMNPEGGDAGPFLPDERIDLASAIAAFTINAAYLNHQEDVTGSVETGKLADLVVLDRNLFEIAPEEISETRVLLTLFEGRPAYGEIDAL